MRLLIAMPVYNELKYVSGVVERVKKFHGDLLLVDDGSTDGTWDVIQKIPGVYRLRHPVNRGYGQSLIDAFEWADRHGYDWVVTMDCDEQHEPERIPDFKRAIATDEWDLISGSRYMAQSGGDDLPPPERRSINATITDIVNSLFHYKLTDSFCGFKAHRVSAMRKVHLTERGYAFPMQLWPQAWAAGLRVTEIPVRLIYNDPNRHFGGLLDDATIRLKHYLDVLSAELDRVHASHKQAIAGATPTGVTPCCCEH